MPPKKLPLSVNKIKRRLLLLPAGLEIYITNRCNLICSYCSSRPIISQTPKKLAFGQIKKAVDLFASYVDPSLAAKAGGDGKFRVVGLTGGEPLLEFELVARTVDYIRKNYKWLSITLATNGTLLDREKAAFLLEREVDLAVSLDGPGKITDLHRGFASKGRSSVFNKVLSNLNSLPEEYLRQMRVMATFSAETAPFLAESVKFLHGFGFSAIEADFDMYGMWPQKTLNGLRKSLAQLRRFYLKRFKFENWTADWGNIFSGSFQNKVPNTGKYDIFNEFSLFCNGYFYPADVASLFAAGPGAFAVGDLESGVDFDKLENIYNRAVSCISKNKCLKCVTPAVNRYFFALSNGLKPETMLENSSRMTEVFTDELGGLLEIEKIFRRLARSRDFGDLIHEPRCRADKEIKTFALNWGNAGCRLPAAGLSAARQAVDYFLYSPGTAKKLCLKIKLSGDFFEYAQGIILYSVLKAAHLRKRLRIYLKADDFISGEKKHFFESHGVSMRGADFHG